MATPTRPVPPSDEALAAIRQQFASHGLAEHQLQALASTALVPIPDELAWGINQITGNTLTVPAQQLLARFGLRHDEVREPEGEPSGRVPITRLQADSFITASLVHDAKLREEFKPYGGWADPRPKQAPEPEAQAQQEQQQQEADLGPKAEIEADALEDLRNAPPSEGEYLANPEERNDDDDDDEPSYVAAKQPVTVEHQPQPQQETAATESTEQGKQAQPAAVATPPVAATDSKQLNGRDVALGSIFDVRPTLKRAIKTEIGLSPKGMEVCIHLAFLIKRNGGPVSKSQEALAAEFWTSRETVNTQLGIATGKGLFKVISGRANCPSSYDFGDWIESGAFIAAEEKAKRELSERMKLIHESKQSVQDAYAERSKAILA